MKRETRKSGECDGLLSERKRKDKTVPTTRSVEPDKGWGVVNNDARKGSMEDQG